MERMETPSKHKSRFKVRAENPDCACGAVGHMTVDELRKQLKGDEINLACPACGQVHLTRTEIEELKKERITHSKRYKEILAEAIASRK